MCFDVMVLITIRWNRPSFHPSYQPSKKRRRHNALSLSPFQLPSSSLPPSPKIPQPHAMCLGSHPVLVYYSLRVYYFRLYCLPSGVWILFRFISLDYRFSGALDVDLNYCANHTLLLSYFFTIVRVFAMVFLAVLLVWFLVFLGCSAWLFTISCPISYCLDHENRSIVKTEWRSLVSPTIATIDTIGTLISLAAEAPTPTTTPPSKIASSPLPVLTNQPEILIINPIKTKTNPDRHL